MISMNDTMDTMDTMDAVMRCVMRWMDGWMDERMNVASASYLLGMHHEVHTCTHKCAFLPINVLAVDSRPLNYPCWAEGQERPVACRNMASTCGKLSAWLENKLFRSPSPMQLFRLVFFSYFLLTSGVVYDFINEPQSTGKTRDPITGNEKPQAILPHRLNAQYTIEGLAAGFMFCLGGLAFILLDKATEAGAGKTSKYLMLFGGIGLLTVSYNVILLFIRMKLPGYMVRP